MQLLVNRAVGGESAGASVAVTVWVTVSVVPSSSVTVRVTV